MAALNMAAVSINLIFSTQSRRNRLRSEEAELLQASYDAKMKSDLSKALLSAGSVVMKAGMDIASGNAGGLLGDIALGVKSVYVMYQGNPELRIGMNKELWELKAADLEDMNELQKQLLTSSWNLLNQYRLPDSARLVENVIKKFYQGESGERVREAGGEPQVSGQVCGSVEAGAEAGLIHARGVQVKAS